MMKIHDVEQNTPEWLALRAGMPTASAFNRIVTSTGAASKQIEDYALELAAAIYAGGEVDAWEGNAYTDRGHELEPEAVCSYEFLTGKTAEVVGFVTNDSEVFGCSPDRLVGDDGLLEIKCQIAKNHLKTIMAYEKSKKPPAAYMAQVQGQLMITARKWCDLFFYHPTLPSLSIRILPDKDFQEELLAGLHKCLILRDEAVKKIRGLV